MVGGDAEPVKRLEPIFASLAPEDGYAHVGASGAGHFTKMIHNGIEYGLMQAYAEGFEIMEHSEFDLDLHADRRHLALRLRRPLLAARAAAHRVRAARRQPRRHRAVRRGLGRGPLDDRRGDRRERSGAGHLRGALRTLRLARRDQLRREGRRRAAQPVRRPRDQGAGERRSAVRGSAVTLMAVDDRPQEQENPCSKGLSLRRTPDPCALVIFGASGDLTHKKLMPALYALMVRRLLPPRFAIVGVARSDGDDDGLPQRHEGSRAEVRARRVSRGRLGRARGVDALRRDRLRGRGRREQARRSC